MLKLHINSIENPTMTFNHALIRYFHSPGLFIGFLNDDADGKTDKENSTVITVSSVMEEIFRCIADKARFHVHCSYAQVANCLIQRYLYIESSDLKRNC